MIEEDVVFVLGAGASCAYGFPSGRSLLLTVADRTRDEANDLFRCLRELDFAPYLLKEFGRELTTSMQPSIDAFLEKRREFLDVGKAAIAASLIPYEQDKSLERESDERWYEYLFARMTSTLRNFESNRVKFITFNYDRSIERFLFLAIRSTYGFSDDKAVGALATVPILHVHGTLGGLPHDEKGSAYSPDLKPDRIRAAANEIRIISESDGKSETILTARHWLTSAQRVCFLGFGFNELNAQRLGLRQLQRRPVASGYGLLEGERRRVASLFDTTITLGEAHQDCLATLRTHLVL